MQGQCAFCVVIQHKIRSSNALTGVYRFVVSFGADSLSDGASLSGLQVVILVRRKTVGYGLKRFAMYEMTRMYPVWHNIDMARVRAICRHPADDLPSLRREPVFAQPVK